MAEPSLPRKAVFLNTPSPLAKALKWTLGIIGVLLIVLVCAGMLLTFWFPSEMVREQLETHLSDLLHGTVKIRSLSFNLLTGLEVKHLELQQPEHDPITLKRLHLDYRLWSLLRGKFTINEIALEQANVTLDVWDLAMGPPSTEKVSPPVDQQGPPPLPVALELEKFAIIDSQFHLGISPEFHVNLEAVNFQSSGSFSQQVAALQGALEVEEFTLTQPENTLSFPLTLSFDTRVDFPEESLDLPHLSIQIGQTIDVNMSGVIDRFLSQKDIQFSIHDTQIHLTPLLAFLQDLVPAEFSSTSLHGALFPSLDLNGSIKESEFSGSVQGRLKGEDFAAHIPELQVRFEAESLDLQATNVQVRENQVVSSTVSADISSGDITIESNKVHNFHFAFLNEYHSSGPFTGRLSLSGVTPIDKNLIGTPFRLPFDMEIDATGNHHTRELTLSRVFIDLRDFGGFSGKGHIKPQLSPAQGLDVGLEARLTPRLNYWLTLVPKETLQGIILQKAVAPDSILLRATAGLNQDFGPQWGKFTTALNLSPLHFTMDESGIEGQIEKFTVLLSSDYREKSGDLKGTLGLSTRVTDVQALNMIDLSSANVILKSSFEGRLSPTFEPIDLRSSDQLQVTLGRLSYQDQSLSAIVPPLKLITKTKEDVLKQQYILEHMRLKGEDLLDLQMKGRFFQKSQEFDLALHMPLLKMGNFLSGLSGPLVEGMATIKPKGLMGIALRASGKIPQEVDLQQWELPLGIKGEVTIQDLEGSFADFQVQGTQGSVLMSYSPEASPQGQFSTDLRMDAIHLPSTLPLHQLNDPAIRATILAPNIDEIQIAPIEVTAQGLDVSAQGAMVGVKDLIAAPSLRAPQLANLFAQLETKIGVSVEYFQDLLTSFGLQGKGKAQVDFSLLKHAQGNLKASVDLNTTNLSVQQGENKLNNINGRLGLKKTLRWQPDNLATDSPRPFRPTEVISQLKSLSRLGHPLTIQNLQIGNHDIHNFSTYVTFDQNTLKIQNLAMDLLGGSVGGNIHISGQQPVQITAALDLGQLDINQLLDKKNQITGESKVAATINLGMLLQEETGALDLSRLTCSLNITHIGKEALDRLLVFLDPEGRNPTMANARAQIELANPSRVLLEIARGQLDLIIHFQGSLLQSFTLNRIPIGQMKNLEKLTSAIPNWEQLAGALKLVRAEHYHFSPEGTLQYQ